jgi:hypothetical protein
MLDRFGDGQIGPLGGQASRDGTGDQLISSSDGLLVRFDEDLLPSASRRMPEVHDKPGLNDFGTGCKDTSAVPLGDGRCERHGYLLNSNQLSEENTIGWQQFAGVDVARGPQ